MSPTTTNTLNHLALDGPFRLSLAVALGVVMLALFAWALWREKYILGRRNTLLFWALRSVAVATVIWMLLAPANVRVQTSTTRRAIAVVTDVSGSMQTVDAAETSDDLRWAVATWNSKNGGATQATDKAVAAIGLAERDLQRAAEALNQHKPESIVTKTTSSANRAIRRTAAHLQSVTDGSAGNVSSGDSRALARRLVRTLDGPEFEAFDRLCTDLQNGRTPSQKGWRESLPDLQHRLAGIRRSLRELARQVAADEASRIAQANPERLTSVRKSPRVGRAAAFLKRLQRSALASIGQTVDVRLASFDQSLNPLTDAEAPEQSLQALIKPGAQTTSAAGTDLSAVLQQLYRQRQEQPLAAVFLLSDMHHNHSDENSPLDVAATFEDTPVYTVPIGNTQHVRDIILQAVSVPAVAMRNDDIVVEVSLQAHDCEGEVCSVQLLQDGQVIDFRDVLLDSGFASRTVRFDRRVRSVGNQKFQVAIAPLEGELTEENNYDEFEVNVTRSDINVLLADELPRWEYRYLAQLFRRDRKVKCDELLFHPRMIATGRREETKTVPVTVDQWDWYDVVLLGDLPPAHLSTAAQQSLIEYLKQRGGTLVLIAGRQAMPQAYVDHPLEQILPVLPATGSSNTDAAGYAFQVTEKGQEHHALMIGETDEETRTAWDFVNRFSPLHELSDWRRPRPSARTLISAVPKNSPAPDAHAKTNAFLCWQPVGRGRIVYLSGPDTYRLRFLRGDRFHYRFWGQLLRWAIASELSAGTEFVRIRTDKSRYQTREAVQVAVRVSNGEGEPVVADDLKVRITSGDDSRTAPLVPVTEIPGEYTAEVRSLPPGVYRIEPVGPAIDTLQQDSQRARASASFTVQADLPEELADTRCDRALAGQIADVTGGQVLPPTAVEEILELTNLEPVVDEQIQRRPLWLEWKYLWLVFGCLQTEWVIRKWKGLS